MSSETFPGFEYTKVVAYDYEGSEKEKLILENGKIHSKVKKKLELDKNKIDEFLTILNDTLSYGEDFTRCFNPHLGFIFFDENEKPKAQISICFICNQQNSSQPIQAQEYIKRKHLNSLYGFSKQGKEKLIKLCMSLGFSNCCDGDI